VIAAKLVNVRFGRYSGHVIAGSGRTHCEIALQGAIRSRFRTVGAFTSTSSALRPKTVEPQRGQKNRPA
jgi:hypothetical protein